MPVKAYELAMTNRTSTTGMSITNCERMDLQDVTSQVTIGPVITTTVTLGNFQVGLPGIGCLPQVEWANTGLSTVSTPGGWDNWGPVGPNQHCYIWAMWNGTNYGLVLSKFGSNGGPNVPGVTHSLRIGWNFSNAAGNGFAYSVIRNDLRTYFVGGTGPGTGPGTGALPVVYNGAATEWTPLSNITNLVSQNAGGIGLQIRNYTAGKIVGVAPNQFWTSLPLAYINNYPNQLDQAQVVEVFTDAGAPCVWSNDPLGSVAVAYFDDCW